MNNKMVVGDDDLYFMVRSLEGLSDEDFKRFHCIVQGEFLRRIKNV